MKTDTKIRCSPEEFDVFFLIRSLIRSKAAATIEIENGKVTVTTSKDITAA
jgi:hypothetical protein